MRLYAFVAGHYLSELQKGLQTAHVVSELVTSYPLDSTEFTKYYEWADIHKTVIILNVGNHAGVNRVYEELRPAAATLNLPVAKFNEDEQSMNAMTTACGIIVPEHFYNTHSEYKVPGFFRLVGETVGLCEESDGSYFVSNADKNIKYLAGTPEYNLINTIKRYKLA